MMLKSYSKHKTAIAINKAYVDFVDTEIIVFWNGQDFEVRNHKDGYQDIDSQNMVGLYTKWQSNLDILADCDWFINNFNEAEWPSNDERLTIIASNGPTGEHYIYLNTDAAKND
tara:strand:+ start:911 stop:1252 length:342 start_codon:yes stop_codon:yes gene_type:complete